MTTIKFDTVKSKAIYALRSRMLLSGSQLETAGLLAVAGVVEALNGNGSGGLKHRAYKTYGEWVDVAEDMIKKWDVRQVRGLFRAFPEAFPKKWQKGNLLCDMDEEGNWVVIIT